MGLPARSWPHKIIWIPINTAGIALVEIVPAVPGRHIHVLQYNLTLSAATLLQFRSGTTPIAGNMSFAASGQATGSFSSDSLAGVFQTADGEALMLNITAAADVDGHLEYVLV